MRIAHCVEQYAPSVGGMQEVVRQLSERMVRAGHEVTVFTTDHPARVDSVINGVRIVGFHVEGNTVRGMRGETAQYVAAVREGGFDVVTLFAAQQWTTDALLPHLHELRAKKVFVPTGFSALRSAEYSGYYERMPEWLHAMDLNVFLSEGYQDAAFATRHGITKRVLIPNGAAEEEFSGPIRHDVRKELGIPAEELLITHIGSYTGMKGHLEAIRLFLTARRTRSSTLLLIGDGIAQAERHFKGWRRMLIRRWLGKLARRRILFRQLDRDRTVSALRQSDLFLFPSRIECSPIVLFEAMAAGVPFLASDAGNSAEIAAWSNGGWVLPCTHDASGHSHVEITAGSHLLDRILADTDGRHAAGERGHAAWKERFTWQAIAERYMMEYQRLVGGSDD